MDGRSVVVRDGIVEREIVGKRVGVRLIDADGLFVGA